MKRRKRVATELQFHSNQGFQYTSQAYFTLTQAYGIRQSMSSKGNSYDNAKAENFFSILKTECIYRQKLQTFNEANELIDRYVYYYNHESIQNKNCSGAADAARLRVNIILPTQGYFCTVRTNWGSSMDQDAFEGGSPCWSIPKVWGQLFSACRNCCKLAVGSASSPTMGVIPLAWKIFSWIGLGWAMNM